MLALSKNPKDLKDNLLMSFMQNGFNYDHFCELLLSLNQDEEKTLSLLSPSFIFNLLKTNVIFLFPSTFSRNCLHKTVIRFPLTCLNFLWVKRTRIFFWWFVDLVGSSIFLILRSKICSDYCNTRNIGVLFS